MKTQPFVSYIIITLNRGEFLRNTVQDVLKQKYEPYELVIVDQSDEIDADLKKIVDAHSKVINYIHVPWKGQTRARNVGAEAARGEILLYIDDDVHIEPDFTDYHVKAFTVNLDIAGVTGAVITPDDKRPIGGSYVTSLGGIRLNRDAHVPAYIDIAFGCNMSFKKSIWREVGGFNETMKSSNLEEAHFSMKLIRAGYKVYYEPKAVTLHFISPGGGTRNFEKRIQWYYPFFFNQFYFFLSFFPKPLLPFFIAMRWRPIVACMFFYGRGRPRALITPWRALADAWRSYRKDTHV